MSRLLIEHNQLTSRPKQVKASDSVQSCPRGQDWTESEWRRIKVTMGSINRRFY